MKTVDELPNKIPKTQKKRKLTAHDLLRITAKLKLILQEEIKNKDEQERREAYSSHTT